MSRYNPNAKWSVLMNTYSKYNKDIRRLDTNYDRWKSTGFDKGLLAPGKKLYKQVKGTSGKPMILKHRAETSPVVCEIEFQDFMSCMIDRNYDNQQCMGQHKVYMTCVHDHKQAVRLAKREAPPTMPPRAANGKPMSRYNMYKQQEQYAKFELDADVQRVQSNILRKRDRLIVPGHVDPKAPVLPSHGIANSKLQMNEGPNSGVSSKKMSLNKKNLTKMADELALDKKLKFDRNELEKLLIKFSTLCNQKQLIDRNQFRDLLHDAFHMTEEILMDRVFRAFDEDMDGSISMKDWVGGLSTFLRGALEEKTVYTFKCFDLNGDGYISREEMFQLLKHCLVKQPAEEDPDEGIKELVEITLKKMDLDHDSRLSLADFTQSVKNEELLLEAFGKCLPDDDLIHQFEAEVLQTK